jgi:hypothetical protein
VEVSAPREVVARFADALTAADDAVARSCATQAGWAGPGDGPGRLFEQAQQDGRWTIAVEGPAALGAGSRAAVPVAIVARDDGRVARRIVLLGEGDPWRIDGVAASAAHVAHYLGGRAPSRVLYDDLPPGAAALAAARQLADQLAAAAAGDERAAAWVDRLLNRSDAERLTVGRLAFATGAGARLEVEEARALPDLGRAVVKAALAGADGREETFLYRTARGVWYAASTFFAASTLLTREPDGE